MVTQLKVYSLAYTGIYGGLNAYGWCVAFDAPEAERLFNSYLHTTYRESQRGAVDVARVIKGSASLIVEVAHGTKTLGDSAIIWDGDY